MSNVFLQQGDTKLLNVVRTGTAVFKTLRLFKNDHDPVVTDTNANYTQADFSGYASANLGTWNAAFVNGDGKGEIDADAKTFSHNGGATANTVYGVYVTDEADNVVYAERFDAPRVMDSLGDSITYTARVTAVSA